MSRSDAGLRIRLCKSGLVLMPLANILMKIESRILLG